MIEVRHLAQVCLNALLILPAACGAAPDDDQTRKRAQAGAGHTTGEAKSRWNALDACSTLGSTAAGTAAGSPVRSSELTTVVKGTAATASFSTCTFNLVNGAKLALLTREAPDRDAFAQSIEQARTAGGTMVPATDVGGLGVAAMWSDTLNGLQVFIDDKRYISVNFYNLPNEADGKPRAIAVAKALL